MSILTRISAVATLSLLGLVAMDATAGEALDRVVSNKILKVATDANWPPQSFVNDNNEMDGFDVDVAREIAARLGVDIEFVTPDWGVITAGRWSGRWDLSVGSMTPTAERREMLDFPAVYYYTPTSAAVHQDSAISKVSELNGKVVAATESTTYSFYLDHTLVLEAGAPPFEFQFTPGEIRSYSGTTAGLDDLRLGDGVRIDAIVAGYPALNEAIENGYPIKLVGEPLFYEPLAIAIDRGDTELSTRLAEIVAAMHADGTLSRISMKWYGVDYTKTE